MAKVEVKMPQMGESITEGTIIKWHKQPGDEIEQDETLLEIGTDKVDTDVPAPESGVVSEVLVAEGDTVDVGTVIAIIETDGVQEGTSKQAESSDHTEEHDQEPPTGEREAGPAGEEVEAEAEPAQVAQAEAVASDGTTGETVDVVMPKMGESIIEGTIISWHKKPGDTVEVDEVLLEIATDKVDTEVPSPASGVVQEILAEEGATVDVGTVIARIGSEKAEGAGRRAAPSGDGAKQDKAPAKEREVPTAAGDGAAMTQEPSPAGAISRKGSDGRFFSPLVRSMAEKEGLSMAELETIEGSGHGGRVTKKDLLDYLDRREAPTEGPARKPQQEPREAERVLAEEGFTGEGRTEIIEMDRMRQIISQHMVESKRTSAHVTSFAEVDVTGLVRLREARKEAFQEREGVKLTFTPFFVKAAVDALRDHPILNASVDGTRIILKKDIHVGIAVALGKTGLVVPVIRDAGGKNIAGLARAAATLAERARSKQLQPDDLQGGTFTVTNVGSLGSLMGTPIISQPQVAILATGAIKKRPVVVEDPELGDVIAIRHMMYVSLSYDHRIVDGAMASSYLQRLIAELESHDVDTVI